MARMKIEFLHHYRKRRGMSPRARLFAYLPRYAPLARRLAPILNLRDRVPGLAVLSEAVFGLSARRRLPRWRRDDFWSNGAADPPVGKEAGKEAGEVVLLVDTFNGYFEPENATAAVAVLKAAGYAVHIARPPAGGRPLCCGRTFLSAGLIEEAKVEAKRMMAALKPHLDAGVKVIGIEPSCLLSLRDEFKAMAPGAEADALASSALMLEEFLSLEHEAGRLRLEFRPVPYKRALLHGHCHQKAFGVMGASETTLGLVPELKAEIINSTCCGMAGAFGYEAEHYDLSMAIAGLDLLPAVKAADEDTVLIASGTSCRHQIRDGAKRDAIHIARLLATALK
jgi:Fe-S oxidoreductase